MASVPQRLGDLLLARRALSPDQLGTALAEQQRRPEPLGQILLRLGFVTENHLLEAFGHAVHDSAVPGARLRPEAAALALLPGALAQRFQVLPLSVEPTLGRLTLAMRDPDDVVALDHCAAQLPANTTIDARAVDAAALRDAIEQAYGLRSSVQALTQQFEPQVGRSLRDTAEASPPVIRLLDAVLAEAVRQGASDIHFQPGAAGLALRYRVDGVLRLAHSLHRDYWPPLAVRVKVLAGLDIAESRAPQDGRFSQQVAGREIDFRVASLPTTQGENIVLRVLDRARGIVPLTGLGLDEASLQRLRLMVARPSGLMLVCGPTGSGKTTTLYSLLNHLNSPAVNIMTLEDPVEYPLADIRQTSLAEGLRLDFASGVRALLRQDPDILLIGEIRDEDTAAMALRAAMTGHQVFSTLHATAALGALPRLFEMGIEPALLAGNLSGLMAQRLVRKLRPECLEWVMANALERRLLGMAEGEQRKHPRPTASARQAVHGGYAGRIALMELLRVDRALDELIARNAGPRELTLAARGAGFVGLAEVASERVLAGLTTLEEIARVVDLTPRVEALP